MLDKTTNFRGSLKVCVEGKKRSGPWMFGIRRGCHMDVCWKLLGGGKFPLGFIPWLLGGRCFRWVLRKDVEYHPVVSHVVVYMFMSWWIQKSYRCADYDPICRGHYVTNPNNALLSGPPIQFTIDLHCLIPPNCVPQWSFVYRRPWVCFEPLPH